jgi:hypothetical protein
MSYTTNAGADDGFDSETTGNVGYDDNSELQPAVPPDWGAIEEACGEIDFLNEIKDLKAEELEKAFKVIQALMAWIHQNGSTNLNGIAIRAIVVSWITLPHLRPLSLTQLANGYGMKKQSVGRWLEEKPLGFKYKFPTVKTGHMNFE